MLTVNSDSGGSTSPPIMGRFTDYSAPSAGLKDRNVEGNDFTPLSGTNLDSSTPLQEYDNTIIRVPTIMVLWCVQVVAQCIDGGFRPVRRVGEVFAVTAAVSFGPVIVTMACSLLAVFVSPEERPLALLLLLACAPIATIAIAMLVFCLRRRNNT